MNGMQPCAFESGPCRAPAIFPSSCLAKYIKKEGSEVHATGRSPREPLIWGLGAKYSYSLLLEPRWLGYFFFSASFSFSFFGHSQVYKRQK